MGMVGAWLCLGKAIDNHYDLDFRNLNQSRAIVYNSCTLNTWGNMLSNMLYRMSFT